MLLPRYNRPSSLPRVRHMNDALTSHLPLIQSLRELRRRSAGVVGVIRYLCCSELEGLDRVVQGSVSQGFLLFEKHVNGGNALVAGPRCLSLFPFFESHSPHPVVAPPYQSNALHMMHRPSRFSLPPPQTLKDNLQFRVLTSTTTPLTPPISSPSRSYIYTLLISLQPHHPITPPLQAHKSHR